MSTAERDTELAEIRAYARAQAAQYPPLDDKRKAAIAAALRPAAQSIAVRR